MSQHAVVSRPAQDAYPTSVDELRTLAHAVVSRPAQYASSVRYLGVFEESEASFNRRIHMPDTHPGVLINVGAPLILEGDDGTLIELPRAFFGGIQNRHLKLRATGTCRYIGLDMYAWGTRFLIDEQVNLATTPIVPLTGIWNDFAQTLEATFQRDGETEALLLLDQFVADLHKRKRLDIAPIRAALDTLYSTDGRFSLNELAASTYLSPSQLERQFKYHTGITPKTFARSIRLDAILAALLDTPARQMTHLAQRFGFTDQAHFIHDFRSLMGCTPSEFLASRSA
jgi:AraC-like DNA-binding protein